MNIKQNRFIIPLSILLAVTLSLVVIYSRQKTITVLIDGQPLSITTFNYTLEDVLEEGNIILGPKDKIDTALDSDIVDNSTVSIKRAVKVNVKVDGEELSFLSSEETLDSLLITEGINLRPQDKMNLPKESKLKNNMKVEIIRVDEKTLTKSAVLDFRTVIKKDNNLANVIRKTLQSGKPGEKHIFYNVVYENGKEVSRKLIKEQVIKKPVDKIVAHGTLPTLPVSRGGSPIAYTRKFSSRATAYFINGITSTGRRTVRNPRGYSTIAVDPRVIPYGTRLYVQNYGFAIAADTGSAIKGTRIDLFFPSYNEAINWGVRQVNVYILK
jgi:uncharacterized protein YabE (DUF348 family)